MSELITPEEFINDKEFVKALKDIDKGLISILKTFDSLSTSVKNYYTEVNKGVKTNADLIKNQNLVSKSTKELTTAERELERLRKDTEKTMAKAATLKSKEYQDNVKAREELKKQKAAIHDVDGAEAKRRGNIGKYKEDIVKAYVAINAVIIGAKSVYQGLSKIIESTEGLGDKVAITISGLKSGMEYFAKSLATMDFSNFFANLSKVYKAGKEYQEAMENIEDANWAYRIKQADVGLEVLQKKAAARAEKDKTQKAKLIDEIIALEQGLEDSKVEIAEKGFKAVIEKTKAINDVSSEEIMKFIAKNKEFMASLNRQGESDLFTFAANQINYLKGRVHDYEAYLGDLKEGTKEYIETKDKLDTTKKDLADLELKKKLQKLSKSEIDLIVKYYEELRVGQGQTEERMQRFLAMRLSLEQELSTPTKAGAPNTPKTDNEAAYAKQREMIRKGELQMVKDSEKEKQDEIDNTNEKAEKDAKDLADKLQKSKEKEVEDFIRGEEAKKQAIEETKMLQVDALNEVGNLGNALGNRKIAELEVEKEKELKAAGDNAKKKEKIEEAYAKKIGVIKRRQAISDKAFSIFNIFLDTARGVMNAMSKVITQPLVPWILGVGALQTAAVIAQPLPKFFKGGVMKKTGRALVGEEGFELGEQPDGKMFLTPDKATEMVLSEGTKIHTHEKTIEKLKGMDNSKVDDLIKEQRLTRKAIAEQVHHSTSLTQDGLEYARIKGNQRTKMIDKYFRC